MAQHLQDAAPNSSTIDRRGFLKAGAGILTAGALPIHLNSGVLTTPSERSGLTIEQYGNFLVALARDSWQKGHTEIFADIQRAIQEDASIQPFLESRFRALGWLRPTEPLTQATLQRLAHNLKSAFAERLEIQRETEITQKRFRYILNTVNPMHQPFELYEDQPSEEAK